MSTATVSVVVATYNRAQLVAAAVRSALEQTHTPLEVIVVDDGSTDDTAIVLKQFGDHVRYLHQSNAGAAAARNTGLRESRGTWVAFLDSDDLWAPHRLQTILDVAEAQPDVGFFCTGRKLMSASGKLTRKTYNTGGGLCQLDAPALLSGIRCGSGMVRRALALQIGGFDPDIRAGEDVDLCLKLSFVTRLVQVREPLLFVRIHGRTLSRSHDASGHGRLRIVEKLRRDRPAFAAAHARLLRRLEAAGHSRLGRALLTSLATATMRQQAREHFMRALRLHPGELRHWRYALQGLLAPQLYRRSRVAKPSS